MPPDKIDSLADDVKALVLVLELLQQNSGRMARGNSVETTNDGHRLVCGHRRNGPNRKVFVLVQGWDARACQAPGGLSGVWRAARGCNYRRTSLNYGLSQSNECA
jgi:hypothetical protein